MEKTKQRIYSIFFLTISQCHHQLASLSCHTMSEVEVLAGTLHSEVHLEDLGLWWMLLLTLMALGGVLLWFLWWEAVLSQAVGDSTVKLI